jgi:hypothetical protein
MAVNAPAFVNPLGIDREHDALRTETGGRRCKQFRFSQGSAANGDLVGSGPQYPVNVFNRAQTAAHGQGDEDFPRDAFDDSNQDFPTAKSGADIEKGQFIGTLLVVLTGHFHRVADLAQIFESDAFNHLAAVDIETGNDTGGDHNAPQRRSSSRPAAALFSG